MDLLITIFIVSVLLYISYNVYKYIGIIKAGIGVIVSFLFIVIFSLGNTFAAHANDDIVSLESPSEYMQRMGLTNTYDNNIELRSPSNSVYNGDDVAIAVDGPELFPLETENEEETVQEEVVEEQVQAEPAIDTSNWTLYRSDCRLTYYGMGEDENGKGYAGLGTRGPLTPGKTIASNTLPYGITVYIEGLGFRTVEDKGSKHLNDGHIDVCAPTWNRSATRQYASAMPQYADVYIVR